MMEGSINNDLKLILKLRVKLISGKEKKQKKKNRIPNIVS